MPPRIASILLEGISQDELRRVDTEQPAWALLDAYDGPAVYTMMNLDKTPDRKARTHNGEHEKENAR